MERSSRTLVNMYTITKEEYDQIVALKQYCELQRNCAKCKIKSECKNIGAAWRGNDISCLNVGRIGKNNEYKYVIFGEGL